MKKIVAFVGSPRRKGNTSELVNEVINGSKKEGAEIKIYYLNDMNIKGCQGCLYCRENGVCFIKDDMVEVYADIKDADVVVIGSPVYIYQVSGQVKLLLDRFFPLTDKNHRPRFGDKKLVMLYTQAAPFNIFFRRYFRYLEKALKPMGLKKHLRLIATKCFEKDSVSENKKLKEKAFEIGRSLA